MASGGSALNVAFGDSVTDVWWSAVKETYSTGMGFLPKAAVDGRSSQKSPRVRGDGDNVNSISVCVCVHEYTVYVCTHTSI